VGPARVGSARGVVSNHEDAEVVGGGRGGMIDAGEEYVCIVEGYILSLGETTLEESRSGEGCWGDV
jgi:hypothetical protein